MKTEFMELKANINSLSEFDPALSNYEELLRCKKGLDLIRAYNLCRPEHRNSISCALIKKGGEVRMMRKRNRRGQSTLEYIIILTVIIAAILVALGTLFTQDESKGLGKLFQKSGEKIETETGYISEYVLPEKQ